MAKKVLIGQNLSKFFEALRVKKSDVTKRTGLSASFLGEVEGNKKSPGADLLLNLHTTFGANIHYLLTGNGALFFDNEATLHPDKCKEIGKRLFEFRAIFQYTPGNSKITPDIFSRVLGISEQRMSDYEEGILDIPITVLLRLSDEFRCNLNWLLSGRGLPTQRQYSEEDESAYYLEVKGYYERAGIEMSPGYVPLIGLNTVYQIAKADTNGLPPEFEQRSKMDLWNEVLRLREKLADV